ncbi:MAG: hypothetical protein AAE986_03970 [Thermoplasmataceae archaeon]|jgi:hypothetical protein|nr:hypothetical protein [Candidatus Thermoplasmatota archaeon]
MSAINRNQYVAFISSLVIALILGFLLLLTGIWYLIVLAGFAAALIVQKRNVIIFLSTFIAGLLVSLIYVILLPVTYEIAIMNEVATLAGISSTILWALMFLVSALLSSAGALIAASLTPFLVKGESNASP